MWEDNTTGQDDSWYWDMIGIDPSTTGQWTSPTASELDAITNPTASFDFVAKLGNILSGKSGIGAQLLGLGGVASLLNKFLGGGSGGGFTGYKGGIPSYTASREMLPIPTTTTTAEGQTVPRRPGQGGIQYFSPMTYTKAADGGLMGYSGGGIGALGGYSDGGRLLKGPGDGTSDSIPATIGQNKKPARLADGEFVVDARTVSELGNGSTDAGAKKLYAMMDRVHGARKKAKRGQNTNAEKHLPA